MIEKIRFNPERRRLIHGISGHTVSFNPNYGLFLFESNINKKVLLRERKRHTARRVVSTPSVVLPRVPPPGGGTWPGYPPGGYRTWVPPRGYQTRVPPRGGTGPGYPPGGYRTQVPPREGGYWTWVPPWGGTWPGYPPWGGTRTPLPPRCGQTNKVKLLPSRRTTYAGGKYLQKRTQKLICVGV